MSRIPLNGSQSPWRSGANNQVPPYFFPTAGSHSPDMSAQSGHGCPSAPPPHFYGGPLQGEFASPYFRSPRQRTPRPSLHSDFQPPAFSNFSSPVGGYRSTTPRMSGGFGHSGNASFSGSSTPHQRYDGGSGAIDSGGKRWSGPGSGGGGGFNRKRTSPSEDGGPGMPFNSPPSSFHRGGFGGGVYAGSPSTQNRGASFEATQFYHPSMTQDPWSRLRPITAPPLSYIAAAAPG